MTIDRVCNVLQTLTSDEPVLPPTELYCEGWLLRIILDWYATQHVSDDPLAIAEKGRWFSEALLPTPFRPRTQGDPLGESRSHADGVIGDFSIGGKTGFILSPEATCFVVLEAKMYAGLAAGVKAIKDYNQAARSVACMVECLRLARRPAEAVNRLAFYVLAPKRQISNGVFAQALDRRGIDAAVRKRVEGYNGEKNTWYAERFQPTFPHVKIEALAWEEVIATIERYDPPAGRDIGRFYERCLKFGV